MYTEYATYLKKIQMNKRKSVRRSKKKHFARALYKEARFYVFIIILGFLNNLLFFYNAF